MNRNLTVFMENKPGKLEKLTGILAEAEINIRGITVASGGEYGVVKLLVDDPDKAAGVLKTHKLTVSIRPVLIALIDDRPGGFHSLLMALSQGGHNLDDCYGFVFEAGKRAAVVFETADPEAAAVTLRNRGITVLEDTELNRI